MLETARTRLRPVAAGDEAFLIALDTDPEIMRYIHAGAMSPEQARGFAAAQVQMASFRWRFGRWIVEHRETGARLGWIELFKLTGPQRDDIQAGYQFAARAQGLGLATEAVQAVLAHAFGPQVQLDRVAAIVRPDNLRSRRLLARCGFTFSGEFRTDGAGNACELWFAAAPE